jgi:hypothetical protein
LKIISEKCEKKESNDKSLPLDSYLVTYKIEDELFYDIVQSSSSVEIFDYYYDTYGKNSILKYEWTKGSVNPKLYRYSKKSNKK